MLQSAVVQQAHQLQVPGGGLDEAGTHVAHAIAQWKLQPIRHDLVDQPHGLLENLVVNPADARRGRLLLNGAGGCGPGEAHGGDVECLPDQNAIRPERETLVPPTAVAPPVLHLARAQRGDHLEVAGQL